MDNGFQNLQRRVSTMLLTHTELKELARKPGYDKLHPIVLGLLPEHVNETSIDVTLGDTILQEVPGDVDKDEVAVVQLHDRESSVNWKTVTIGTKAQPSYLLYPGEFVLASTQQLFNLPSWLSAEYKLKSSMARRGLEHLTAGWIGAGFHGSALTLELKNVSQHHAIELVPGTRIGQVVFWQHHPVSAEHTYAATGRYVGQGGAPMGA